jgi:predicted secreted hydrolase
MKDYVMMICVNGKDHALSFGPRVALPGLLRDHLLLAGTKTSRNRQSMMNAETETGTQTFPFPGHHGVRPTHGSAVAEWQPHRPQGDRSAEWWNLTAVVCDPAGTRYFLSWTVTHPGRRHLGQQPPQLITQIKPGQGLYACRFTLISYQASIREAGVPAMFVMNDHEVWDEETSTLCLRDAQHEHECAWSFDGERMDLAASSPTLAVNLKIQGGSQVMWAEDQTRAAGLDRDSAGGSHSFSYSLPHLQIAGSVTYTDERGKPTAVDVSGSGWADRQWGDFLVDQG